jgi:hypothetical protein
MFIVRAIGNPECFTTNRVVRSLASGASEDRLAGRRWKLEPCTVNMFGKILQLNRRWHDSGENQSGFSWAARFS